MGYHESFYDSGGNYCGFDNGNNDNYEADDDALQQLFRCLVPCYCNWKVNYQLYLLNM